MHFPSLPPPYLVAADDEWPANDDLHCARPVKQNCSPVSGGEISVGSYRYYFSCITFGYYYDPPINLHGLSVGETVAVPTDGGSPDEGFVALNFLKGTWTSVHAAFFASVEHNF